MLGTPRTRGMLGILLLTGALDAPAADGRLSHSGDYKKYIDSLLEVKDFGIHYFEDGLRTPLCCSLQLRPLPTAGHQSQ